MFHYHFGLGSSETVAGYLRQRQLIGHRGVAVATTKSLETIQRDSGKTLAMVDGRCRSRSLLLHPSVGDHKNRLKLPQQSCSPGSLNSLPHEPSSTRCQSLLQLSSLYRWRSYSRSWRAVNTRGYWPVSSYVCTHIFLLSTLILTFAPGADLPTHV